MRLVGPERGPVRKGCPHAMLICAAWKIFVYQKAVDMPIGIRKQGRGMSGSCKRAIDGVLLPRFTRIGPTVIPPNIAPLV